MLTNINYSFEPGKIYGVFGKNGSGKTMLLRSLAGLIIPTSGKIFIDNKELHH
ncbi:ATP-binding cassette domain-containing protein, partial [Listeria monocytogenes]|nr:ATP-binding cassette domain-containing protein [Listeria monocytogenes]EAF4947209.1 ATP-binding cassette domain-containing protein [Listeria monocytogenes]HAK1438120.1 ATP-binding cassette domain-containing protein [Listeria monocytogenes]HBJ8652601.1 ATP-binding cassette domain-containing protein [Listeria monocytogenes]HEM2086691.1 ATP-binding cassette domain-containing protein [Listeria monocytogenes]